MKEFVIIISSFNEHILHGQYDTIEEAEKHRSFLEAHMPGAKVEIGRWNSVDKPAGTWTPGPDD